MNRSSLSRKLTSSASSALMTSFPKQGTVILEGVAYLRFKMALHKRDGWRCKICGRAKPLTVSHMIARAILRRDTEDNAISACVDCHKLVTLHVITVSWASPDSRDILITGEVRRINRK
jgi:hypothetical protein